MPTPGVVRAMALDREISAAIKSLPEEQRKDARKLAHYSSAIGNTIPNILMAIMILFLPIILLANYFSLILGVFVGIGISVAICLYAFRTRRRLVAEMNKMIEIDPDYWKPIQKTLETAVLRVDGTRIIRK